MIEMLQQTIMNTLELNEKKRKKKPQQGHRRYKEGPKGNLRIEKYNNQYKKLSSRMEG